MGMFGCLPKRITCIWCSWKLARLVQRKLLSRSTDYEFNWFQILKLTNKCKLEYLPQRLEKSFLYTRCSVVRNEVWLCFGQQGHHSCETWTIENSVSKIAVDSRHNHWVGILSIYENRPFAFSCMYFLSCNCHALRSVFNFLHSQSIYRWSWAIQFRIKQVGIKKSLEVPLS